MLAHTHITVLIREHERKTHLHHDEQGMEIPYDNGRILFKRDPISRGYDTIVSLSVEMAEMMKLDLSLKRMDSLMVSSNIKKMSRLELVYTCVANLVKEVAEHTEELPEGLKHYIQADDRNRVIYHNRSEETSERIAVILKDTENLKQLCGSSYDESSSYQLLLRVLKEQTIAQEEGALRLRRKYQVDHMPIRGLVRSKRFFGCKIAALNFSKFCKYMQGCINHAPNTAIA